MSEQENIQIFVEVNTTDANGQVLELRKQINLLKSAIDKASQSKNIDIKVDGAVMSIDKAVKKVDELEAKHKQLTSLYAAEQEKQLQYSQKVNSKRVQDEEKAQQKILNVLKNRIQEEQSLEAKRQQSITNARNEQAKSSNVQYWKDLDGQRNRRTNEHKSAFESIFADEENQKKAIPSFVSYQQQLHELNTQAQKLHQTMRNENPKQYAKDLAEIQVKAKALKNEMASMPNLLANSGMDAFMMKFNSHLRWIVAGGVIAGMIAVPLEIINTIKEIEVAMAGMNQVIDHTKLANEAAALGVDQHTYAQQKLNEQTEKFINLAATYGEKTEGIIEAGKLWGRMYKDLDVVNALTAQSAKLAVADNFSLVEANRSLN